MGHELLVCHSHLPEGELTLPLSVHSFSTYLVSTCYSDCWAAQIKHSVCGDSRGAGRNDEGLVLVSEKSWNLTQEACREGFQGLVQEGGPLSGHKATEATGDLSDQTLPALIADTGSRFASTGSCLLGKNTYLWEEQAGGWFHSVLCA